MVRLNTNLGLFLEGLTGDTKDGCKIKNCKRAKELLILCVELVGHEFPEMDECELSEAIMEHTNAKKLTSMSENDAYDYLVDTLLDAGY